MNIAILIYLQDTKIFEEFYTEKAFLNRWDLRAVWRKSIYIYVLQSKRENKHSQKMSKTSGNPWSDRAFLEMPKNCSYICICCEHFQQMTYVQLLCMFYRHTTTSMYNTMYNTGLMPLYFVKISFFKSIKNKQKTTTKNKSCMLHRIVGYWKAIFKLQKLNIFGCLFLMVKGVKNLCSVRKSSC